MKALKRDAPDLHDAVMANRTALDAAYKELRKRRAAVGPGHDSGPVAEGERGRSLSGTGPAGNRLFSALPA